MPKNAPVGRSWRTWAKHELMNSLLGQEVGAVSKMKGLARHVWLDLTAGDASPVDGETWHRTCSPGILAYHAVKASRPTSIVLHEIQPATFDRLLVNLTESLPELGYVQVTENSWRLGDRVSVAAVNISGHLATVDWIRPDDAVFVLNDPNAITEWAMRDSFPRDVMARRAWCFRSLSTMGCNPAGLKRLPLEERERWFELVGTQQKWLAGHRDLLLAAIERDDAQWAYLIHTAQKWRSSTESVVRTAFNRVGRTAAMTWYGTDPDGFEETKRVLFLTKKERAA